MSKLLNNEVLMSDYELSNLIYLKDKEAAFECFCSIIKNLMVYIYTRGEDPHIVGNHIKHFEEKYYNFIYA